MTTLKAIWVLTDNTLYSIRAITSNKGCLLGHFICWIMKKVRTYSKYTQEAVALLSQKIKFERKRRKWSEHNLAERAGISRAALQKIENGEMTCAIGIIFEVATIVGINLFDSDGQPFAKHLNNTQEIDDEF